jgi:hypothetical protein
MSKAVKIKSDTLSNPFKVKKASLTLERLLGATIACCLIRNTEAIIIPRR